MDCEVVIVALLPLITNPCGPIHNVIAITGVSTTGGTAKAQNKLAEVPVYTTLPGGAAAAVS